MIIIKGMGRPRKLNVEMIYSYSGQGIGQPLALTIPNQGVSPPVQ